MRSIVIMRSFAVSVALLGVTPTFARSIFPHNHNICGKQNAEAYRRSPFLEMPNTISDGQAKANAASKTWPGDMMLD
jgi:hypothetical protein